MPSSPNLRCQLPPHASAITVELSEVLAPSVMTVDAEWQGTRSFSIGNDPISHDCPLSGRCIGQLTRVGMRQHELCSAYSSKFCGYPVVRTHHACHVFPVHEDCWKRLGRCRGRRAERGQRKPQRFTVQDDPPCFIIAHIWLIRQRTWPTKTACFRMTHPL